MRKFAYLTLIIALLVAACSKEKRATTAPEAALTITSDEIVYIGAEGGFVPVTYIIENATAGEEVKVQILSSAMIVAAEVESAGLIKVEVAANTTTAPREGGIIVSYASHTATIKIKQEGAAYEVVDIAANQLIASYYGDYIAEGLDQYWLIMTKDGFVDGSVVPGGEYFRIDLLAPIAQDGDTSVVPDGKYIFDRSNALTAYSILNIGNSDYAWVDEDNTMWAKEFSMATLTVEGDKLHLEAMVDDKLYRVTFEGEYEIADASIKDHISTFTEDVEIDVSNCKVSVVNSGDYWNCGYCDWYIEFSSVDGIYYGPYLVLDLLATTLDGSSGFEGVYRSAGFSADDPTKPNFGPGVFVPGMRMSDDGVYMLGSLYVVYKDGKAIAQAPLYDGVIAIAANGDGTHTIKIEATDDAPKPNKLTLNWTGVLR